MGLYLRGFLYKCKEVKTARTQRCVRLFADAAVVLKYRKDKLIFGLNNYYGAKPAVYKKRRRGMGIIFEKYRSGMNFGGWISQCDYNEKHIKEFITEEDVKIVAGWGCDHIRVPVDYPVLESAPFEYSESGLVVLAESLRWCKNAGLNMIIDLHKAPGYVFDNFSAATFFSDETAQDRFVALWEVLARRFKGEGDNLVFELLNEVVDAHGDAWNKIIRRTIAAIHAIDPTRYIIIGGANYNSPSALADLELFENPRILYTFHFYEPLYFTHQRAGWERLKDTGIHQPYPGKVEGLEKLAPFFGGVSHFVPVDESTYFDMDYIETRMKPAIDFAKKTGKELYIGEYGAIDKADLASRINYIRDINAVFDKHSFGRALWSFRRMDFPSIDDNNQPVSPELVKILGVK
jgi:hypothetical protein